MRFTVPFQNFWLPLLGGAIVAIPALFFAEQRAGADAQPTPAAVRISELSCGPFVDSFGAMRAEAERVALLAASATAPLEEELVASPATIETWREIAEAARLLDAWMQEAASAGAPLNLSETAVVTVSAPLTRDMRSDAHAIAVELADLPSEPDVASLIDRMAAVERAAATVARSLEPIAICAPRDELSYAPAAGDCETLDPEYQLAVAGPCAY